MDSIPNHEKDIQEYINNFRRRIAGFLKPGVGLACNIYPARTGGAVLEFVIGPAIANTDNYREPSPTLSGAVAHIDQHAFGGNLDGFVFGGTNTILEDNRIIFVKDGSPSQWTDHAAEQDLYRVLPSGGITAR